MNSRNRWILASIFIAVLFVVAVLLSCCDQEKDFEAAGTTNFSDLDLSGSLNYGTNDLYPLGYASDGQQLVYGTTAITTTGTAAHGLTTITMCLCTLGRDPDTDAGDAALCTTAVSSNVCTLKTWQDDFSAATEADISVHWVIVGAP